MLVSCLTADGERERERDGYIDLDLDLIYSEPSMQTCMQAARIDRREGCTNTMVFKQEIK